MTLNKDEAEWVVMDCLKAMAQADPVYRDLFTDFGPMLVTMPEKYKIPLQVRSVLQRRKGSR